MIQKHGGKTQIVFIDKQEKIQEELQPVVPTQHQPPSKEVPSSTPKKHRSPNSLICISKPTTIPYNVQNSSLWISGMRDPYIDICKGDESACDLISVFSLTVMASTWRLRVSYSSLVEFSEASVIGEDSGSFHCLSTSRNDTAICHFSPIAPYRREFWNAMHPHSVFRCNATHLASGAAEMILFWPILSSFSWRTFGRSCNLFTLFL